MRWVAAVALLLAACADEDHVLYVSASANQIDVRLFDASCRCTIDALELGECLHYDDVVSEDDCHCEPACSTLSASRTGTTASIAGCGQAASIELPASYPNEPMLRIAGEGTLSWIADTRTVSMLVGSTGFYGENCRMLVDAPTAYVGVGVDYSGAAEGEAHVIDTEFGRTVIRPRSAFVTVTP